MQSNLHSAAASSRLSLRRALIAAGVLVTGLSVSPLAMAQSAQALTETQATMLPKLVVTATRGTKNVLDVPMTVSVISAEELEKRVVRDIQDLVRYEPGVSVDRTTSMTNPWGQLNSFRIRGASGNRVRLIVDGSRVQEQIIDGSRNFVDPSNMKSIEIVRGPNSVQPGSGALRNHPRSGRSAGRAGQALGAGNQDLVRQSRQQLAQAGDCCLRLRRCAGVG